MGKQPISLNPNHMKQKCLIIVTNNYKDYRSFRSIRAIMPSRVRIIPQ